MVSPTLAKISSLVAAHYGLTLGELRGRKRARSVAWPRQVAMYLCRRHAKRSYPAIGEFFGRNHTTVMHAVRAVEQRIVGEQDTWSEIVELHGLVKARGPGVDCG